MKKFGLVALIVTAILASCKKKEAVAPADYGKLFPKVKSIVAQNCTVSCHAPSHGLMDGMPVVLETDSDLVNRAQSIKAALVDPVTIMNKRMPPNATLSQPDITTVVNWVAKGGKATD